MQPKMVAKLKCNRFRLHFSLLQNLNCGDITLRFHCVSVQVRVLLPAPNQYHPNQIFPMGDWFGFIFLNIEQKTD